VTTATSVLMTLWQNTHVCYYYNNHTSNNNANNVRNRTELEAQVVTRCTAIANGKVQMDCMKMQVFSWCLKGSVGVTSLMSS